MPKGVSFELGDDGLPRRVGTKKAHTFGWFWGIPKNAPEPELAYKLARFVTSFRPHLEECKNFFLIPVNNRVNKVLKAQLGSSWKLDIYEKSTEQLRINENNFVPRFKTLDDYRNFIDCYYDAFEQVVVKKRYSIEGPNGAVERDFLREYLR
jgi:ABC-type glycerol-3-phosphate transport system substrate-binding protein